MFEKTLLSLPFLPISRFWKGGDFMGIEQNNPTRVNVTEEALSRLEGLRESEVPWGYRPFDSAIGPDQGRVENGNDPKTHPLRKGII